MAAEALPSPSQPGTRKRGINRRTFVTGLVGAGVAVAELGSIPLIAKSIKNAALHTPHIAPALTIPDHKWIHPGSLKAHSGTKIFLTPEDGFFTMLNAEAQVPLVAQLAKGALEDAKNYKSTNRNRIGLANLHVLGSNRFMELVKSPDYRIEPGTNLRLEAADYAISGVTIFGTGGRLSLRTYQRLNLLPRDLPRSVTASKAWWGEQGPGWLYFRRLFGRQREHAGRLDIPGKEPSGRGIDGFSHASGNSYLAFNMLNFTESGHPLKDAIPDIVKKILSGLQIDSSTEKAIAFSNLVEDLYELKGTVSKDSIDSLWNGKWPEEGFWDRYVQNDRAASNYGGREGVNFYLMASRNIPAQSHIEIADRNELKNEGADPRLKLITAK